MLANQGYAAYANNKSNTASPAELTLMLYEGAIKFCNIAIVAIENKEIEKAHNNIVKVENIIQEMRLNKLKLKDEAERLLTQPNFMNVPAAIRELEKIELIRQSDRGYRMDYAVTATQKEILKAFNMTAANVRTQAAAINEDLMKIEKEG